MIGMIATPTSTKGAGSLPVLSLNADLLKKCRVSGGAKGLLGAQNVTFSDLAAA